MALHNTKLPLPIPKKSELKPNIQQSQAKRRSKNKKRPHYQTKISTSITVITKMKDSLTRAITYTGTDALTRKHNVYTVALSTTRTLHQVCKTNHNNRTTIPV